jgi:DNA primase
LTGRLLPDAAADRPDVPRYESLPGPRPLLGLGGLPSGCDRALLVEGPFDYLLLSEWGEPALALGGSACAPAHLDQFARFRRVGLLLDRDDAGARAAASLAAALGERAVVITLPDGAKDVGDLAAWPDGRRRLVAALADAGLGA